MAHDILIRGGLLLDGTGAAGRLGDLAIRDGRIVAMGADLGADAAKLIDATGLAVAPGFIDSKTPIPTSRSRSIPRPRARCARV